MAVAQRAVSAIAALPARVLRMIAEASPVSVAIAVTALSAASLFVVVDAVRSLSESGTNRRLVAQVQSGSMRPLGNAFVASASLSTMPDVDVEAAALSDGILTGVAERGFGAFGAAFAASALTFRRRKAQSGGSAQASAFPLEHLLAGLPGAIAWWDADGTMIGCNPQFTDLLLDGDRPFTSIAYTDVLRRIMQIGTVQMLSNDDHSRSFEVHQLHGSWLLVEERALEGGGFVTLINDVSERRRNDQLLASVQEEQRQLARRYHDEKLRAEAASHSKTQFLAHLSHDIRTPLNHIIGFAELIRHQTYGPLGDARYLNYIDTIKGSGEKLLSFFASILDLAELESGERALQEAPLEVDKLLNATAARFKAQAARAGVALRVGPATGAMLLGDSFCLERMLGNIVENALRFTPTGGRVTLNAYAAHDGVVLEIADSGVGMSAERVSALSQPFAAGDATVAPDQGGYGLGLPIARAIAEQSGGRLAIDSRPGLGTTVAISLPLLSGSEQQAAA